MIVEDENLFKVKNDGNLDPLTLEKITQQRREELKAKLDKHSLETAEKMKEEVLKEFALYRTQMREEIDNQMNTAANHFNEKLDSNLNRFDRDVKAALADIHKPLDLLDTSVVHENKYHNLQNIFDMKDYMKAEMESSVPKLDEKFFQKEPRLSCYDPKNFDYNDTTTPSEESQEPKTFKEKIRNSFRIMGDKFVCFKKINGLAFRCFQKK